MVGRLKSPHAMMRSTRLSRQQYQLHYRGIPDMRSTYMCYQHSTLCASHSCECTASSAWWGFTNARDQQKHDAFIRRSQRSRFVLPNLPSFAELCRTADERLFNQILSNNLLPPLSAASQHYNLRQRRHSLELPNKTIHLTHNNFIQRMLYLDSY